MDLDSATPNGKRSRSKVKSTTSTADASAPRSRKGKKAAPVVTEAEPTIEVRSVTEVVTPDGEVVTRMIETAAYYLAEQRNFEPGHELDDWLEAERQIRALYG